MRKWSCLLLATLLSAACTSGADEASSQAEEYSAYLGEYEPTPEQLEALARHHEQSGAAGVAYAPGLLEFLEVRYSEERVVLIDGVAMGATNELLLVPRGMRRVSLEGGGSLPPTQDVPVQGSSPDDPVRAEFEPDPDANR